MIYTIIEHIASIMDAVMLIMGLGIYFGWKDERKKYTIIFIALAYLNSQFVTVWLIQLPLLFFTGFIFSVLCLKGEVSRKTVGSILVIVPFVIAASVFLPILSLILNIPLSAMLATGTFFRIYILIMTKFVELLIMWTMFRTFKKTFMLSKVEWFLVFMMISGCVIILTVFMLFNIQLELSGMLQFDVLVICLMIAMIITCCIYMVMKISYMNRTKAENSMFRLQVENQEELLVKAKELQENARFLNHDMKHYAGIWLTLLKNGQSDQAAAEIETFIGEISKNSDYVIYMEENELINSVLYEKMKLIKKKCIKCDLEITTHFDKKYEMDIAVVLSNLLDNAIRAEEELPEDKRYISLRIFNRFNKYNIVISNRILESVICDNPKLKTTKTEKGAHGLGIKSVKRIAEKYGAYMDIEEEKDMFIVHIESE